MVGENIKLRTYWVYWAPVPDCEMSDKLKQVKLLPNVCCSLENSLTALFVHWSLSKISISSSKPRNTSANFLPRGLLWRLVNMALRKLRLLPSLHALPWMRSWKEKCLEIYWIISRQVSSCDWWQSWRQLTLCLPMTLLIDWTNENFDGLWSNKARVHLSNSNRVVSILFFSLSSFLLLFNYSFIHFHSWKQQLIN